MPSFCWSRYPVAIVTSAPFEFWTAVLSGEMSEEHEEILIDYKSNGKILSVRARYEKYQLLSASVHGNPLSREELIHLLILATGDVDVELHYEETKLYEEEFIDHLRNVFFTFYQPKPMQGQGQGQGQQQAMPHIPILLSIEGNIGAGKS